MYLSMVIATFILWTPGKDGMPVGLFPGGVSLLASVAVSMFVSSAFAFWVVRRGNRS